jgi:predicted transcriptional regulator
VQELSNFIKRQNLKVIHIEEGEEVQAKGIHNTFNKIITENFPNLEKVFARSGTGSSRIPNRLDQN